MVHLTLESYLLAWCQGRHSGPEFGETRCWLWHKWRTQLVGGVRLGVWRAFHRRHPDAMAASMISQVVDMHRQFEAEIQSAAAAAAIEALLV